MSMNWSKWIAIILVLGGGSGVGWLGLSSANQQVSMTDRWTGTEHADYAKDQLIIQNKHEERTKDAIQLAEANEEEIERHSEYIAQVPLIQKDIEHIKDNFEQQKSVDINQSKLIQEQGEKLNKIDTGVQLILQKIEE